MQNASTPATTATGAVTGFSAFALSQNIQRGIEAAGFSEPRPIQAATIQAVLDGRDVLGLAQTGTGKTAAFGLPLMERLLRDRKPGPRALIAAPTRELAAQIDAEIRLLGKFTQIRTAVIFGGVSMGPQVGALRRGVDIVVGCPGRLLDHVGERTLDLSRIETLVLDEADHMFDMGFLPDIRRILQRLPAKRQNLLFSATMPPEIRGLADGILQNPHVVELANAKPAETIDHELYPVHESKKLDLLLHLLGQKFESAIVFTRTKHRAKRIADRLAKSGLAAVALQGNMSQAQREKAMTGFRKNKFNVLVATDIAARGIDVAQVSHVINFDIPNTPEAYTHRIGRTGRSERSGQAYTFVTSDDRSMVRAIERKLGKPIKRSELAGFTDANALSGSGGGQASGSEQPQRDGQRPYGGQHRRDGQRHNRGGGHHQRRDHRHDDRRAHGQRQEQRPRQEQQGQRPDHGSREQRSQFQDAGGFDTRPSEQPRRQQQGQRPEQRDQRRSDNASGGRWGAPPMQRHERFSRPGR